MHEQGGNSAVDEADAMKCGLEDWERDVTTLNNFDFMSCDQFIMSLFELTDTCEDWQIASYTLLPDTVYLPRWPCMISSLTQSDSCLSGARAYRCRINSTR